ncbi:MAG: transporter ATP-binding protein [Caulobacter sp.]|nr:transporter ATP-binding protein [Caulobacter sp.]
MTLAAESLSVRLGDKQVLDGVEAVFAAGKITAVVGPNGAGKSTLLACLAGLRRPQAGRARLDDWALLDLPPRERAKHIAFLPQTPEVAWAIDVRTLVGLGRTAFTGPWGQGDEDRAAVDRALAATELEPFADRVVGTLSGGERARALIARAIAGEPDWLLADEPLAGLDPGHALDAADLFRALAGEGRGVILTLHDLAAAIRMADRVLVLAEGRVLADGAPLDALTSATLAQAYGVEARVVDGLGGPMVEVVGRAR